MTQHAASAPFRNSNISRSRSFFSLQRKLPTNSLKVQNLDLSCMQAQWKFWLTEDWSTIIDGHLLNFAFVMGCGYSQICSRRRLGERFHLHSHHSCTPLAVPSLGFWTDLALSRHSQDCLQLTHITFFIFFPTCSFLCYSAKPCKAQVTLAGPQELVTSFAFWCCSRVSLLFFQSSRSIQQLPESCLIP